MATERQIEGHIHTSTQMESDHWPETPASVVGYSLKTYGLFGVIVLFLLAAIAIEFYYLQASNQQSLLRWERSNERWDKITSAQMEVIREAGVAQSKTTLVLSALTENLNKHQAWEEKILDLTLPKIDRIEQRTNLIFPK